MSRITRRSALAAAPAAVLLPAAQPPVETSVPLEGPWPFPRKLKLARGRKLTTDEVFRRNVTREAQLQRLSVAELADRAELTTADVTSALAGPGPVPLAVAAAIAEGLGFSLAKLMKVHRRRLPDRRKGEWPDQRPEVKAAMGQFRANLLAEMKRQGISPRQLNRNARLDRPVFESSHYAGDLSLDTAWLYVQALGASWDRLFGCGS